MQNLFFYVWLISFSTSSPASSMLSQMTEFTSFSRLNNVLLCVHVSHFFINSYVSRPLSGFQTLAVMKNAAMNMGVHISLQVRSGVAGSYGSSIFNFLRNPVLFSTVAMEVYFPTRVLEGYHFSPSSPAFVIAFLFHSSHPNRSEVISYCGFDLHFSAE